MSRGDGDRAAWSSGLQWGCDRRIAQTAYSKAVEFIEA
jgi:hypothetical protein